MGTYGIWGLVILYGLFWYLIQNEICICLVCFVVYMSRWIMDKNGVLLNLSSLNSFRPKLAFHLNKIKINKKRNDGKNRLKKDKQFLSFPTYVRSSTAAKLCSCVFV